MSNYKMYNFVPLTIYGMPTGGKGVLSTLLDGNNCVSTVIPMVFHDSISSLLPIYQGLMCDKSTEVAISMGDDKRCYFLRKLLIDYSAYYISLETAFRKKKLHFNFSSIDFRNIDIDFKCDFFELDKNIILEFLQENTLDENINFRIIMTNILEALDYPYIHNMKYCMSISSNILSNYHLLLTRYPEGKIIFIDRPLIDAIGISFAREAINTHTSFQDVLTRMNSKDTQQWIQSCYMKQQNIDTYCREYPKKIFKVNFTDLISNTYETMQNICNFLDIKFDKIYTIPTFMGKRIVGDEFFIEQDNIKSMITSIEYIRLKKFITNCL